MIESRMRVSDEDRDRTAQELQRAYSEGRLSAEELDERVGLAFTAKTYGDLLTLVDDLPVAQPVVEQDTVVHLESKNGHVRRAGDWEVPRRLQVVSKYGSAELDLSQAVLTHLVVEIDFDLKYGSATLVLPPGASANIDRVRTRWGTQTSKVSGHRQPGVLHVLVSGELAYGVLTIRYPRRHWLTH